MVNLYLYKILNQTKETVDSDILILVLDIKDVEKKYHLTLNIILLLNKYYYTIVWLISRKY